MREGFGLGHQRTEEIAGVEQARHAAVEARAGGGQIHGCGHGRRRARYGGCALFAQIFCQRIAAERHACGVNARIARRQCFQHKADFARIARMVEHGRGVGDAAAAAEVGDHAVPAPALRGLHHFHGVMAHAAAFQPVKQHHQRRVGAGGVDEIIGNLRFAGAVGQQLATVGGRRGLQQLGENGFGIAVVQPKRRVGQVYVHFSATVRMNRH